MYNNIITHNCCLVAARGNSQPKPVATQDGQILLVLPSEDETITLLAAWLRNSPYRQKKKKQKNNGNPSSVEEEIDTSVGEGETTENKETEVSD
jgi:hypothetical protein